MALKLYLDDCAYSKSLLRLLRGRGHHVVTPQEAGLRGASDKIHFQCAVDIQFIIITKNPRDSEELHSLSEGTHSGIFAIYQDSDQRDMSYQEIVIAIDNLEKSGVPIKGQFIVLNHWR